MPAVRRVATSQVPPIEFTPEVLDTEGACRYLKISDKCLRARIREGQIIPAKVGSLHRFRKSDLDAFLDRSIEQAKAQFEADKQSEA